MRADDGLDDCETETGPRLSGIKSGSGFEDPNLRCTWYAPARVGYRDPDRVPVGSCPHDDLCRRPGMSDRISDQVVDRLSKSDGVDVDARKLVLDGRPDVRSAEDGRGNRIAYQDLDVDLRESKRTKRGFADNAVDSATCAERQPRELPNRALVELAVRKRLRYRRERSDGAANLVHEKREPIAIRRCTHVRSAMRSSAQRAVSRSIGSSPSASSPTASTRFDEPTLPAATSAFRRSHRASFRGT